MVLDTERRVVATCSVSARQIVDLPLAVGAQKQKRIAFRMLRSLKAAPAANGQTPNALLPVLLRNFLRDDAVLAFAGTIQY